MPEAVSLNGRDGSGKSTQRKLLRNIEALHFPVQGMPGRPKDLSPDELFDWKFFKVPLPELMDVHIRQLDRAYQEIATGRTLVLDRGVLMHKAVCAAIWMMRTNGRLDHAREVVDGYFEKYWNNPPEEFAIWFENSPSYQVSAMTPTRNLDCSRRAADDPRETLYSRSYQGLLRETTSSYFDLLSRRQITVDSPALDIQRRLRRVLRNELGLPLEDFATNLKLVLGFSGADSRAEAEFLRSERNFYRFDLGYFASVLKRTQGKYSPDDLARELMFFATEHNYIENLAVAIDDPQVVVAFKQMLGPRFHHVHVPTTQPVCL